MIVVTKMAVTSLYAKNQVMRSISKLLTLLAYIVSVGCSKETANHNLYLEGIYSGKFIVSYKNQDQTFTGDVTVRFKADSFFCTANKNRFPAGGSGTYEINGDQIIFKDKNVWTADFDWALILNHNYTYLVNGNDLTLTKAPHQHNSYIYKLTKD
ncbi:hypothetical protein HMPREF3127_08240 [Sphingobacterium sp. HMSC13C05]|jgi:uncharacterized protein Veg|nr:hypothetical protein BV902_05070 [Sphingobacterium sp. B29]OFV17683.1 hypothetical protein HMPREF3127_08240 [Sphingobacterium sp. HMSC13C05]